LAAKRIGMREVVMRKVVRRDVLKALGAAAFAASGGLALWRSAEAAPELRYAPEKGAELKVLRWKRFVQGDEDQWMANIRKFTEQTGVSVRVESVGPDEIVPKAAMAASVGGGPDVVMGNANSPQLYPDKCVDLTDLANYLGRKYGGWYDVCQRYCTHKGRWISLSMAVVSFCVVYRDSMVKAAGFSEIPRDLPGFLQLCQALKARGTPVGLALGNAPGDTLWCSWLLWSHGGSLVDENNRVTINSKETITALEYAQALYATFIPGTLSWGDPHNNKAFLSGAISLTHNAISIYYVAKTSGDPALQAMALDIQHAHLPIGPVGRATEVNPVSTAWVFNYTKYPNASREYLRFMLEREQYEAWQQASFAYMSQTLRAYESSPIWTSDPKITPFRDGGQLSLYNGYRGTVGHGSAACVADFVIPNMVAEAASGQSTPKDAAARAQQRAVRFYDVRH
jgi:multiple sugar transport system substrate-binding protein